MMAGVVLIVVAIVIFVFGMYILARQVRLTVMTVTLSPGEEIAVGVVSPGKVFTMSYMDSINKSLEFYVTAPPNAPQRYIIFQRYVYGLYVVTCSLIGNGTGTLYLVNNYTVPVTITYYIYHGLVSVGSFLLMSIVIGIIGVVLAILGAVLKPRK